jgi:hypothetical protein
MEEDFYDPFATEKPEVIAKDALAQPEVPADPRERQLGGGLPIASCNAPLELEGIRRRGRRRLRSATRDLQFHA